MEDISVGARICLWLAYLFIYFLDALGQNAATWNSGRTNFKTKFRGRYVTWCFKESADSKLWWLTEQHEKMFSSSAAGLFFISQPLISARRTARNQSDHKLCFNRLT